MNNFEPDRLLNALWQLWKRFPEQIKRLSILLLVVIVLLVAVRVTLVPSDFGKYGHFRASAVEEIVSQEINYAGHEICAECHDDLMEVKNAGYHKSLACEVCHGPAAKHTEEPEPGMLQIPRGRGYCPLCHEYLPSRPTGFPQIVSASHNPIKPCITCHEPHDPKPPETPKECSACHANIARTKTISHHAYVECIRCHETPENHKISPRQFLPNKPQTREFCGGCHAQETPETKGIPQVDIAIHGERYVCWQCHYPHLPEAN
ncbi:MAG: hypothetical protein ACE5HS_18660 [bacterium]